MSSFVRRHIGPSENETKEMLSQLSCESLEKLSDLAVPETIRTSRPLDLPRGAEEHEALSILRKHAEENQMYRSYIGMGYSGCLVPGVIQRNILENPGWYTQYTPYQSEIAQGRLEALVNFQQVVMDLTAMEVANASLLDEATAAAEAMAMCWSAGGMKRNRFFVAAHTHPQTIEVVQTRAKPIGIEVVIGEMTTPLDESYFGGLVQYPDTFGEARDLGDWIRAAQDQKIRTVVATDLLALTLLKPPGEMGADIVIGNSQRFGVPFGFGGPHAAFLSCKSDLQRRVPGRLVGVSKDAEGNPSYRLALQTREQHIRREKATSNICTAQVLLAIMASMYAVYHGPQGLKKIAMRIARLTRGLKDGLTQIGFEVENETYFDSLTVNCGEKKEAVLDSAKKLGINLRDFSGSPRVGISFDETVGENDLKDVLSAFGGKGASLSEPEFGALSRTSPFLKHSVFNDYHSETEMLRYIRRLEKKDLSLGHSMISLGSCTMKLNATTEMFPVTWPEFAAIHPYVPIDQAKGYVNMIGELEDWLSEITGFAGISMQSNAGSQGEYAGLLVIRAYHEARGDHARNICLIPKSAHGTNPASATMAGMKVIVVDCDSHGNVDLSDLERKAKENASSLSALMVTYPSTHGVFEKEIRKICDIVHQYGGQVYMDGANMNAQIGLCRPGEFGPDVCHLNLHKTFCIPHGGGGPGMGPIGVAKHLVDFLPRHSQQKVGGAKGVGAIASAPWGSPSILPISWAYIRMMGAEGLRKATEVAILNANYMAKLLDPHYPVLYKGEGGWVAHECIIDLRPIKAASGVEVEDVAKRLMDYGYHAPTVSFPVIGTMMIEPTESESKAELDRFCDAMIAIREEISEIEAGKVKLEESALRRAPHTTSSLLGEWDRPYSREKAVFPRDWVRERKFWPAVARIDNVYGDRHLQLGRSKP